MKIWLSFLTPSVTRFAKIATLQQDFQKLWRFFEGSFSIWKTKVLWPVLFAFGPIFIAVGKWTNIEKPMCTYVRTYVQVCTGVPMHRYAWVYLFVHVLIC